MKCCIHSVVAATKGWLLPFFFFNKILFEISFWKWFHELSVFGNLSNMIFVVAYLAMRWSLTEKYIRLWDEIWLPKHHANVCISNQFRDELWYIFFLTYGRWTWQQRFRDSNIASNLAKRYCWKITLYFNIAWDIIVLCPLEKKIVWDIILWALMQNLFVLRPNDLETHFNFLFGAAVRDCFDDLLEPVNEMAILHQISFWYLLEPVGILFTCLLFVGVAVIMI